MKLNAYLQINRNCEAALSCYPDIFNGKLKLMRFRDAPSCEGMDVPPPDNVMHGCVGFASQSVMVTDSTLGETAQTISGAHIVINTDDVTHTEELFAAFAHGGNIQMPIAKPSGPNATALSRTDSVRLG